MAEQLNVAAAFVWAVFNQGGPVLGERRASMFGSLFKHRKGPLG